MDDESIMTVTFLAFLISTQHQSNCDNYWYFLYLNLFVFGYKIKQKTLFKSVISLSCVRADVAPTGMSLCDNGPVHVWVETYDKFMFSTLAIFCTLACTVFYCIRNNDSCTKSIQWNARLNYSRHALEQVDLYIVYSEKHTVLLWRKKSSLTNWLINVKLISKV